MRVVVVHNRYRSAAPSGENRVVDQETAALAGRGHEVIRFERNSDEIEGWSALRKATLPARVVWSRATRRDLAALLRAERPDVVHVHNTFPLLGAAVLYACGDAGIPAVATLHNYKLVCASGDFFRDGKVCHACADGPPLPAVLRGCYRGSRAATVPVALSVGAHRQAWRSLVSAYIFISAAQRDLLGGLGLSPDRVFVRHNLVPRAAARPAGREPVVAYAGRLDEAKGAGVLMAAWDRYLRPPGEPGLRLVVAGSGPLEKEMAAWAATRHSVEMAGLLDATACAKLMARARAVVLPSAWEETFGLAAVEAMAAGTPPIAAAHGSFPELITAGLDGVLVPPRDPEALAAAFQDVEKRPWRYEVLGRRARATYESRFDPDRGIEGLLDIYRYAIKHPVRTEEPT